MPIIQLLFGPELKKQPIDDLLKGIRRPSKKSRRLQVRVAGIADAQQHGRDPVSSDLCHPLRSGGQDRERRPEIGEREKDRWQIARSSGRTRHGTRWPDAPSCLRAAPTATRCACRTARGDGHAEVCRADAYERRPREVARRGGAARPGGALTPEGPGESRDDLRQLDVGSVSGGGAASFVADALGGDGTHATHTYQILTKRPDRMERAHGPAAAAAECMAGRERRECRPSSSASTISGARVQPCGSYPWSRCCLVARSVVGAGIDLHVIDWAIVGGESGPAHGLNRPHVGPRDPRRPAASRYGIFLQTVGRHGTRRAGGRHARR